MDNKTLNELDGSSVLTEVMKEKNEFNRKSYKTAIKNAVLRNDKYQETAAKAIVSAEKTKARLDALVDGGMESFLATSDEDEEENDGVIPYKIKKAKKPTPFRTPTGNW